MESENSSNTVPSEQLAAVLTRWKPVGRSGLLPALIEAQEIFGWLSPETLKQIAQGLNVPLSEAYGVADFYAHLYLHPVGKKIIRVCDDVPCYLAGSEKVCASVEKHLRVHEGETTADGAFTYEIVPCLGHCDHAPVVMIDKQVHEDVNADQIPGLLKTKHAN